METTMQSSTQGLRSKITTIEAVELAVIGFVLWCLAALVLMGDPETTFGSLLMNLITLEVVLLGSWAIYNLYIRVARAAGRTLDIVIWVLAAMATASYTFWAWSILDVNRWLMKKFFYRGEAPVEYAWSVRSKQIRKAWEQMQKAPAKVQ